MVCFKGMGGESQEGERRSQGGLAGVSTTRSLKSDNESNEISRELLPGLSDETAGAYAPAFFCACL